MQTATGWHPEHGHILVLEREAMKQSTGFVKAEAIKKELDDKGRVALYINFDTDKATIRPDGMPVVDEIAKLLQNHRDIKLSIEGHTDSSGAAAHNRELSSHRAQSVVNALLTKNIEHDRLSASGFGAEKPVADNSTPEGRAKNRRVELVKVG